MGFSSEKNFRDPKCDEEGETLTNVCLHRELLVPLLEGKNLGANMGRIEGCFDKKLQRS